MINIDYLEKKDGFEIIQAFCSIEVSMIRELINEDLRKVLHDHHPEAKKLIETINIENYHLAANQFNHADIWTRHNRLFKQPAIDYFYSTEFYKNLKRQFPNLKITNEIHGKEPEIVWRIVRPGEANDVGPIHADKWFWDLNGWHVPDGKKCIKVWAVISGDSKRSGLYVVPKSQFNSDTAYSTEQKDGINKPIINDDNILKDKILLDTKVGEAIIFSYQLLHGGAQTQGNRCRVSIEFTLMLSSEE